MMFEGTFRRPTRTQVAMMPWGPWLAAPPADRVGPSEPPQHGRTNLMIRRVLLLGIVAAKHMMPRANNYYDRCTVCTSMALCAADVSIIIIMIHYEAAAASYT